MLDKRRFADFVKWDLEINYNFVFEIDIKQIRFLMPSWVIPLESRPDTALILVAAQQFAPGNVGYLPRFREINFNILVQPNRVNNILSVPKFCLYVLTVSSDCTGFLDYTYTHDKMPVYYPNELKVTFDTEEYYVRAEDQDGPIFEFQSNHLTEPDFKKMTMYGCYYAQQDTNHYAGHWLWQGQLFEHQTPGNIGRIYPHAFFRGLAESKPRLVPYMQGLTSAEQPARVDFGNVEHIDLNMAI